MIRRAIFTLFIVMIVSCENTTTGTSTTAQIAVGKKVEPQPTSVNVFHGCKSHY